INNRFQTFAAPPVPGNRSNLDQTMPKDSLMTMSTAVYGNKGLEQSFKHTQEDPLSEITPGNLRYHAGSICKMVMLALTLRLYDQNKISLDDTIETIISKFQVHALIRQHQTNLNPITIRQLLNHTSGLRDGSLDPTIKTTFFIFNPIVEAALRRGDPIEGKITFHEQPGNFYYANSNFAILGYLLEAIYGKELDKIFDEHIKQPLGLTDSTMAEVTPDDLAHGEIVAQQGTARESLYLFGAGCLYTTPADSTKFFHAFFTDRNFISQQSLDIAKVTKFRTYEIKRKDGAAFSWKCFGGMLEMFLYKDGKFYLDRNEPGVREVYGHGGWTSAHSMFLIFDPQTNQSFCAAVSKRHIHSPEHKAEATPSRTLLHYFTLCCCIPTTNEKTEKDKLINDGSGIKYTKE
ncbi:MAG: serine hydrolase, partial [Saprospiraceae bacterium]|nr:serine hydrolase [Saprospiraceae bacterium]